MPGGINLRGWLRIKKVPDNYLEVTGRYTIPILQVEIGNVRIFILRDGRKKTCC